MTITEANATQTVLAWVLALQAFEPGPDAPTDTQLRDAVTVLAARSHQALGAGTGVEAAAHALTRLLEGQEPTP